MDFRWMQFSPELGVSYHEKRQSVAHRHLGGLWINLMKMRTSRILTLNTDVSRIKEATDQEIETHFNDVEEERTRQEDVLDLLT